MNPKKLSTKKTGDNLTTIPRYVLEAGLEPARAQCPLDFKSNVSTNSTTRADVSRKNPDSIKRNRDFERETGLGPATPTLARSCSTN